MRVVATQVIIKVLRSLVLVAVLITASSGCALWPSSDKGAPTPGEQSADTQGSEDSIAVRLSLPDLMMKRLQLCMIPVEEQLALLDDYRAVFVEGAAPEEPLPGFLSPTMHQLNAVMLASCDPGRTPEMLSEILAVVTSEEGWPSEYMAFFDLLVTSHRAYKQADGRRRELQETYRGLKKEHEALQQDYRALEIEHQNTIKGISDIERGIDMPDAEDIDL